MVPRPVALGLMLCEKVIVEEGTKSVSLIGTFSKVRGRTFPLTTIPFCVVATLTGAQGEGTVSLNVTDLRTNEEKPVRTERMDFAHRFAELRIAWRLPRFVFPEPGDYVFTLMVDDEWVAQRRIIVRESESEA
jgi:hypothetical protein